jgi:hypothetical protein
MAGCWWQLQKIEPGACCRGARSNPHPDGGRQEPRQAARTAYGPAQQKEATRRRAQGATLQELADSYDRSISTMRRATRAALSSS